MASSFLLSSAISEFKRFRVALNSVAALAGGAGPLNCFGRIFASL